MGSGLFGGQTLGLRVLKFVEGRGAHKRCKPVKFITFLVNNDCCCYKTAHSSVLQYLINGHKFIRSGLVMRIIVMNLSIPTSTYTYVWGRLLCPEVCEYQEIENSFSFK